MAGIARRFCAMLFHDFADRLRLLALFVFLKTFDIGRRRRWRCARDVFQNPRATKNRRRAIGIRRHHQDAAFSEQAPAIGILECDSAETVAAYIWDSIMQRETFIQ